MIYLSLHRRELNNKKKNVITALFLTEMKRASSYQIPSRKERHLDLVILDIF